MKRLLMVSVLFSSIVMLNFRCYHEENGVRVHNKLKHNIMCQLLFTYPDLSIPENTKDILFANPISEVDIGRTNSIRELELREKDTWNAHVKNNMLMLMVYDKDKLASSAKPEDALIERYYFSYNQLEQLNWVVTVQ